MNVPPASCSASPTSASASALRLELLRPQRDPLFRVVQLRLHRLVLVACRLAAQRVELDTQTGERFRRRGGLPHTDPLGQPAVESCPRPPLIVLAIEACLQYVAGRIRARNANCVVAEVQRLPTVVEFDQRGENRAGSGRQPFQLRQNRVRRGRLVGMIRDRLDPLPGKPSHAMILVPGGVGEFAQALRRAHTLRGGQTRFRMVGDQRDLDQRILIAKRGDRDAATVSVPRAPGNLGPDRVGATVGLQQCRRCLTVRCLGKYRAQHDRKDSAHRRIGFRFPRRGKGVDRHATRGRRRADLRRRIGCQKAGKNVRVGWQLRHAEHALGVVGMLVQRGTK